MNNKVPLNHEYVKNVPSIHDQHRRSQFPPEKAKPLSIGDLFPSIDKWAIGYNPVFEQFKQLANEKPSYPPYDIVSVADGHETTLSVAVAGFSKEELSITVKDSVLTISGKKEPEALVKDATVVHKGIANRDFTLNFVLAEFHEVDGSSLRDGMLYITIYKEIPEEEKPKVIEIE